MKRHRKKNRKPSPPSKPVVEQVVQAASLQQGTSRAEKRNGLPFWGDDSLLPELNDDIMVTDDPAAVPRSLGHPPLPGNEQIASHFFEAVHIRAVQFGAALAASATLEY